jgi:hypothetical protein
MTLRLPFAFPDHGGGAFSDLPPGLVRGAIHGCTGAHDFIDDSAMMLDDRAVWQYFSDRCYVGPRRR